MMDLDLFKNVIDEVEGNIESITLASRGEPTLNRSLGKMLEYCNDKFLGMKINTKIIMIIIILYLEINYNIRNDI